MPSRNIDRADLHIHSNESDGLYNPVQLIEAARNADLSCIAITDHDTVAAVDPAMQAGYAMGIEVIPAVELSAVWEGDEVHILGYLIDHQNSMLAGYLSALVESRRMRAYEIIRKLEKHGVELSFASIEQNVQRGIIARPHIAQAMVQEGIVGSYQEAFDTWLGNDRPAFAQKHTETPAEVIEIIHVCGGLAVLAHPGGSITAGRLAALIEMGLDGIEVVHPRHSLRVQEHLRVLSRRYRLLTTGGSDFHAPRSAHQALGQYTVPISDVDALRDAWLRRQRKGLHN